MTEPSRSTLPQGYRQGLVTAITVFLGFSLSFLRFWSFESPGHWTPRSALTAAILGAGILVQLWSLSRSLDLRDEEPARYAATVRCFFAGAGIVVAGVVASILAAT